MGVNRLTTAMTDLVFFARVEVAGARNILPLLYLLSSGTAGVVLKDSLLQQAPPYVLNFLLAEPDRLQAPGRNLSGRRATSSQLQREISAHRAVPRTSRLSMAANRGQPIGVLMT